MAAQDPDAQPKAKPAARRRSKVKELIAQYQHDESLCRYKNKLCLNPRARKRRGGLHTFCEMHREAANRNQRRLDQRKRIQKRQLEAGVLQGINPITATASAITLASDSDCDSPMSPRAMLDTEMASPEPRNSAPYVKLMAPSSFEVEPSPTPVALKDEDIYALRWLFAVDETAKRHVADAEMAGDADVAVTHVQWV